MIIRKEDRPRDSRTALKGGQGVIDILNLTPKAHMPKNSRLLSEFIIKPNESIGAHAHKNETEIYYILSGKASVLDNSKTINLYAGDTAITQSNIPHNITNVGSTDLHFIAIIVLD